MKTDFVSIAAHSPDFLRNTIDVARHLKKQLKETGQNAQIFAGKTAALIFEKPSLRTRVSFTQAMNQPGGQAITLTNEEIGLGKREAIKDVARVLGGMCDAIVARTFSHDHLLELAKYAPVPVVNALTDYSHPCQAMADLMTVEEHFGKLAGLTMAYVGDGNNVARSLAVACGKFGVRFVCCTPPSYALPEDDMDRVMAQVPTMDFVTSHDPQDAVREADIVYTDTWVSMGQEAEKQQRLRDFAGFQINESLLAAAPKHAVVLHCLPAYRDLEITEAVIEGPQSLVFDEAWNRLHYQKGLMAVLLGKA